MPMIDMARMVRINIMFENWRNLCATERKKYTMIISAGCDTMGGWGEVKGRMEREKNNEM